MKPRHFHGALAACVVFLALVTSVWAQEVTPPRHIGAPQDWSQNQIVFSRDGLARHPGVIDQELRVRQQAIQRWQAPNFGAFHSLGQASLGQLPISTDPRGSKTHRDWNVAMGARISPHMYPAKFSFDPGAPPDCTNDYVVFGLAKAGVTGGQANLVAFNNLYSDASGGLCGLAPTVLFAYNTTTAAGGKIVTSPVLSEDGSKIAFVESLGTSAVFHVLTWTAGQGAIASAAAPTMTSLTFAADNSTTSSPWVDYNTDTAYLGADNGNLYKITGVFHGTPTLAGGVWPITLSTNFRLSPPVLDSSVGKLMVGSANGNLYQIDTATGAQRTLVVGDIGSTNPGVAAPPVVDITNGTTFVVSADDGTSAVLVEVDTVAMTKLAVARIGLGAAPIGGVSTALNIYQPAFSNDYYNDPSTGVIRLCGTGAADTTPWQYSFGFSGPIMSPTPSFSQQLLTSTAARCTGWTEFFNPSVGPDGTDFFFFGINQDCTSPGSGFPGGCVIALTGNSTITKAALTGGTSGIVVDNYSTEAQASSIYLCAGRANTAYKFTQSGLE